MFKTLDKSSSGKIELDLFQVGDVGEYHELLTDPYVYLCMYIQILTQCFFFVCVCVSVFLSTGVLVLFLAFFAFLHCWLNAFAEMLCFGDRKFYKVNKDQ